MKAQEFRLNNLINIPNWYRDDKDSYFNIRELRADSLLVGNGRIKTRIDIEKIKQIPVTEELLIKFGFELTDSNYKKITKWSLKEDYIEIKYATIGTNPIMEEYMFKLSNVFGYWFFENGHHKIEFVHQLQNLYFALTGEELELNEDK